MLLLRELPTGKTNGLVNKETQKECLMEYQNQESEDEQGSNPQSEQNKTQSNQDMPTSAGGSKDHQDGEQENVDNVVTEDASSRVRDENQEEAQPQIDSEGEFKNKTGWTREEGLSDEERKNAEEEDLNGLHSGDSSVL